ncbi:hypothetical protein OIU34_24975 [Pararhizobium sp. BT-229]|uniref:hypothetical protein n=1 Tax=Pararhizobium sp. BT-229 TaxID=2986923 RepID=UPI0021F77CD6|nr:hypothetical protein [Pararhizobium sp. BT-229]MCV9965136.1 hypothetical protein [Pararhizobium sp. BT-229]
MSEPNEIRDVPWTEIASRFAEYEKKVNRTGWLMLAGCVASGLIGYAAFDIDPTFFSFAGVAFLCFFLGHTRTIFIDKARQDTVSAILEDRNWLLPGGGCGTLYNVNRDGLQFSLSPGKATFNALDIQRLAGNR